ncbi:unnamed protein product, partial [Porites evermanni]
ELLNLSKTPEITKQDRFCVHKVCFEKLIDHHSTYRDLLYRIKAEYEECIEAIERGQREAVFLSGKLASTLMQPETISRNLKQRGDELELKIKLLKVLNQRNVQKCVMHVQSCCFAHKTNCFLALSLSSSSPLLEFPVNIETGAVLHQFHLFNRTGFLNVLLTRRLTCMSCIFVVLGFFFSSFLTWDHSRNGLRSYFLPSFTVEQLTNTAFLTKKLADLKSRVAVVKLEDKTRFVPKALKGQLLKRLREKEEIKEELLSKREKLKMKIMSIQLSMAVQVEVSKKDSALLLNVPFLLCFTFKTRPVVYRGAFGNIALALKQTNETMEKADEMCQETKDGPETVGDSQSSICILEEVDTIRTENAQLLEEKVALGQENNEVLSDPAKDREAEFILEYIENFFELFEEGKVEEAVLHAAHSPKGVLRTMETLKQFKEYDASHGDSSLFVAYWEALLPTVATGCNKPSEWETIECIKCLLDKNRVDLLTHWIAQDLVR